jgi:hypothetical protein
MPAMVSSCRRTIRPRYRTLADGHNAFTFFTLEPAEYATLRTAARGWGVTLNDALIALLLLAQDAQMPDRDRAKRRHELAVASIMNLRDAHREDTRATFGQFLSSFRVSHPVPAGDHARRACAGRESRHCTSQAREALPDHARRDRCRSDRRTISHARPEARCLRQELSGRRRRLVAERQRAVGVGNQQRRADLYPGVPTGPASPVVVAVTTSGNTLCAGITYRTAAAGPDDILDLQAHIKSRIRALK